LFSVSRFEAASTLSWNKEEREGERMRKRKHRIDTVKKGKKGTG